jgi:demethylmenaquinone methyltransferase/2-methoxy-6-polyprenyl-1,4-benzoquinol methylase
MEGKKRLVREHFDSIARTYDAADRTFSAGLDDRWRREGIRLLDLKAGDCVLDACGGTGRLARLAAGCVLPGGRVVVYDFNRSMMEAGREAMKRDGTPGGISFVQGDGESMSFPDGTFDAVAMGLGLRNLARPEQGLDECFRVLAAGGRLMIFEFSIPANRLLRGLYHLYSFYGLPLLGRVLCGTGAPFRYLAESVRAFPGPEEVAGMIRRAGFGDVRFRRMGNGLAVIYIGIKRKIPNRRQEREGTR